MSTFYFTGSDFASRYPGRLTNAEVTSVWIPYGCRELDRRLGSVFTVPFSSNNFTAFSLAMDLAWLGILTRTGKIDDSKEIKSMVDAAIKALISGKEPMVTVDGVMSFAAGGSQTIWSSTQDYKPVFDQREAEQQRIDPDMTDADWDADT